MTADVETTSFVSGFAMHVTATFSLLLALRLQYASHVRPPLHYVFAAGYGAVGIGCTMLNVVRAMHDARTAGEIMGIIAGATFIIASFYAFRSARAKRAPHLVRS